MLILYAFQNAYKRYLFSLFLDWNKNVRKIDILLHKIQRTKIVQKIVFLFFFFFIFIFYFYRCLYNKQNIILPPVDTKFIQLRVDTNFIFQVILNPFNFEITGYPCNLNSSQRYDLFTVSVSAIENEALKENNQFNHMTQSHHAYDLDKVALHYSCPRKAI